MSSNVKLTGLVPDHLKVRSARILMEALEVQADIGFHDFEIGRPQRLILTVEVWLEEGHFAEGDDPASAWDYDFLRREIASLIVGRRFNLQETVVREIYDLVAARRGVAGLTVRSRKPDIYPDCGGVGVELSSF